MIKASLQNVHDALAHGLDQTRLTDGTVLTCSNRRTSIETVADSQIPYLLLSPGRATTAEWQPWLYQVSLDVPAELRIKGAPHEAGDVMRGVIEDLFGQIALMRSLLVDDKGQVHLFSEDTIKRYEAGELTALAFRGGPFIRSFNVRPIAGESPYATADLIVHLEYLADHDPTVSGHARAFAVGTVQGGNQGYPLSDPEQDYRYSFPMPVPPQDVQRQGLYAGRDASLPYGYARRDRARPPFPGGAIPSVVGIDPMKLQNATIVSPGSFSVLHPGTVQLDAIALLVDGSGNNVTPLAAWQSSAPTVATVSSTGLVTGVAAGSAVITATVNGIPGTATVTVT